MPYTFNPFTGKLNVVLSGSSKFFGAKALLPSIYNNLLLFNSGNTADPDAVAYCQASGATDFQAINYFVKGIKALGLWSSMVCWPLRSTQNAGTGSTAYSLGGLGTYNGPLLNGPTWGADGVNFDKNLQQRIETTLQPNANNHGIFVCSDWSQAALPSSIAASTRNIFNDNFTAIGLAIGVAASTTIVRCTSGNGTVSTQTQLSPFPSSFACFSMLSNGSEVTVNTNNTQETTHPIVNGTSSAPFTISGAGGAYTGQATYNGKIAFAMALYTPANNTAFYALYKQTLGQGLGLP